MHDVPLNELKRQSRVYYKSAASVNVELNTRLKN